MRLHNQRASDRTADIIDTYYAAFNRGDWDMLLALLDPQVVHDINQGGTETGTTAFREFLVRMDRSFSEQLRDVRVMASNDGRRAAAEYVVHGTYVSTYEGLPPAKGQGYVLPGGTFFDLFEGRITRVTNFYNLKNWLAQINNQ